MSTVCHQSNYSLQASAGIFIWLLQVSRQSLGLSAGEAARLAAMETTDRLAIEAGRIPEQKQLRPMADALELKVEQLAILDRIRRKG
jgi:hypothetical protein